MDWLQSWFQRRLRRSQISSGSLALTVLMAEQNFRQAIRIADRGYVLVHGQIVLSADDPQALQQNELVRRYYLGVG